MSFLPKGIGRCLSKMVTSQTRVCGGSLNTDSAIVSADGSFIFVPSGAAVRMYSSLTGDRVAELHGHAADVTAICVDPADTQQVPLLLHVVSMVCCTPDSSWPSSVLVVCSKRTRLHTERETRSDVRSSIYADLFLLDGLYNTEMELFRGGVRSLHPTGGACGKHGDGRTRHRGRITTVQRGRCRTGGNLLSKDKTLEAIAEALQPLPSLGFVPIQAVHRNL